MVPVLPDWDCLAMTPAYPVLSPYPKPLKVLCVFHFFALVVWGGGGGGGRGSLFCSRPREAETEPENRDLRWRRSHVT